MLQLIAKAKINLFLHVVGKRVDGYHLLESLVGFTDFGDILNFKFASSNFLEITGVFAKFLQHENINNNLIMKALKYLQNEFHLKESLAISLQKNIPVGAGIGGGSSNCAILLLAVNQIFNLKLTLSELQEIAILFGADVPVCLEQKSSFFRGIGDEINSVDFNNYNQDWLYKISNKANCSVNNYSTNVGLPIILVNPKQSLSTQAVFKAYQSEIFTKPLALETIDYNNIDDFYNFLNLQSNDLTRAAIKNFAALDNILVNIKNSGASVVKMSGSGLTCFGLYKSKEQADVGFIYLKEKFKDKDYWLVNTFLK